MRSEVCDHEEAAAVPENLGERLDEIAAKLDRVAESLESLLWAIRVGEERTT